MKTLFDSGFDPVTPRNRRAVDNAKRRRPLQHRLRVAAKQYAEQHGSGQDGCPLGLQCQQESMIPFEAFAPHIVKGQNPKDAAARRYHLEQDFKYQHEQECRRKAEKTMPIRVRDPYRGEEDVGLELARSSVQLPSDRDRLQRRPSLEREEAFCDPSTYKGKVHSLPALPASDDAQVAELYRMGLLYDESDKATNDTSFDLNTISHDTPVYSIRAAKKARKLHSKARALRDPLSLDLSFADLGNDDELARYFVSSSHTSNGTGEDIQHDSPTGSRKVSAPLRVIYELDNKSSPSFDVDTSQPPDLVLDSLSDYDYFTESDMDEDMPSQKEVYDGDGDEAAATATSSGAWVLLGNDS